MPIGVRTIHENRSGPWHHDETRHSLIRDKDNGTVCWLEGGRSRINQNGPLIRYAPDLAKASSSLLDACDNLAIYEDTADRQTQSDLRECVARARAEVRAVLDSMGVIVL